MLQSMTGFATKLLSYQPKKDSPATDISISIKSLNSRFFEATCKIPSTLSPLETEIIKQLKKLLHRGHLFVTIYLSDPNAFKGEIELAKETAGNYLKAINSLKSEFKLKDEPSMHDLLNLPNIFVRKEISLDKKTKELILSELKTVADKLLSERNKEGAALQKDIEKRINLIDKKIEKVSQIFERVIEAEKIATSKKIDSLESSESGDQQRQQLYNALDKMDINEEIVRFKSHLESFKSIVKKEQAEKGKAFDFTLQELSREINTITAKSPDLQISDIAISTKVEIEKIREQVQNIV